jgi:hypothetical protein
MFMGMEFMRRTILMEGRLIEVVAPVPSRLKSVSGFVGKSTDQDFAGAYYDTDADRVFHFTMREGTKESHVILARKYNGTHTEASFTFTVPRSHHLARL